MRYYEVFVADSRLRSDAPLTYSYGEVLSPGSVVTVPLRGKPATGFVLKKVGKPSFAAMPIKAVISNHLLPEHCLALAYWLKDYYHSSLGEVLRQFAPSQPSVRTVNLDNTQLADQSIELELHLDQPLTADQKQAIKAIESAKNTSMLLHGDTGTGKTRVYLEIARKVLDNGLSVLMLTPEIALTSQLAQVFASQLPFPIYVLHSQLTPAKRKKIWLAILESDSPVVVIGPRSALFSPVKKPGLVILDEAHEPTYKQEQSPRYHAGRVASQLGVLTDAKVILGTATPSVAERFVADAHKAIVRMSKPAIENRFGKIDTEIVDLKDRTNFTKSPHLSNQLIDAISSTLSDKKQIMVYLNRRGSARLILCNVCGWQLLCPNCDIPLVYHGDGHICRCHVCGFKDIPPLKCPVCANTNIIYRSIGTKALLDEAGKLFPEARILRFDSDNTTGERVHELYHRLHKGEIDILVGTQVLAKGFDLPKLGLVGIVAADTSLSLPDYTSEERTFQLLYQVIGRVGRGHGHGRVVLQTYEPDNAVIKATLKRDYLGFYDYEIEERHRYRFPPYAYLMRLVCRRATYSGAEKASVKLAKELRAQKLPVEIIGPTPAFYARRGPYFYWQLVVKSKQRHHLLKLADTVPANWMIDLDPANLL